MCLLSYNILYTYHIYNMDKIDIEHFDFIFLIISSDNLECYSKMRDYIRKYFSLYKKQIKYFFIELKEDIENDICEMDDYLYVKGIENITPGIYIKTIKTMQYINTNYNYDFVIRTNVSSFWNLDNILELKNNLPLTELCVGHRPFDSFISGTSIILSKDVCKNLSKTITISNAFDDVYISDLLINLGYNINHIEKYWKYTTYYLIYDKNTIEDTSNMNNYLFFRVKNNNRKIDLELFDILYNNIYKNRVITM